MSRRVRDPWVWFPAVRSGSGADVLTERLVDGLHRKGLGAEISWLPRRAEFLPWTVSKLKIPECANIIQVNSWLHSRFIPTGMPVVTTIFHSVFDSALSRYKTFAQSAYHDYWVRRLEMNAFSRAQAVVSISHYTNSSLPDIYGLKDPLVIPVGIDLDRFFPIWRSEPKRPFRVLFVGNWTARKGADLLIPIMNQLGSQYELLVLAGLRGKVFEDLPMNVNLIGRVSGDSEMAELYRSCDALLFPSRLEGFGMVALEAEACGIPVVASLCSALPEVVRDRRTGFLCRPDSVSDFVEAIRYLAENPRIWRGMGRAARGLAESEFGIDTMVNRYVSLYLRLLEQDEQVRLGST